MAYEIISQNNTVTTLADENGNVIRVPSRAVLAVGETFTLTKVNNNVATLEDSSGKIYRDVPCVAVLYGGGASGDQHNLGYYTTQAALEEAYPTAEAGDWAIVGATDTVWIWDEDTSAWVDSDQKGQVTSVNGQTGVVSLSIPDAVQYSTMPTASADNLGDIVQFTGTTDANYTNGYFYKCVGTGTEYTGDVAISANTGDLMVECDGDDFINFLMTEGSVADPTVVVSGGMVYTAGTTTWTLTALDDDNNTVCTISATQSDYESAGFTFMGTPVDGDICAFVSTITGTTTYAWTQTNVQPAPSGLPDQTGNAGKFLTTDGTDASWSDKPLVNNTYPNTSRLSIGDSATCYASVALAIGKNATASSQGSTAIGEGSYAGGSYSIAIAGGHTSGIRAIQIGSGLNNNATNSDRDTVKIANSNGNFEIMSADGTVPTARLTKVNTTATLAVADWSSNTQTVSVTGMTANGVVLVSPTPANQSAYTSAGILCTAQAAGSLTFTCDTVPSADITVTVVML